MIGLCHYCLTSNVEIYRIPKGLVCKDCKEKIEKKLV